MFNAGNENLLIGSDYSNQFSSLWLYIASLQQRHLKALHTRTLKVYKGKYNAVDD